MEQGQFNPSESLRLIDDMIRKAKGSYHDTGIGPMLWGTVVSICALITWTESQYDYSLPFDIWLLTLIAVIPQIIISYKERKQRQAVRYEDHVMSYIWSTFGISIFLLILINNALMDALKENSPASVNIFGDYISAFFLLIYGIPTIITGGVMKFKYMLWGGVICWLLIIPSFYTSSKTDMLLIAIAAIAAWLIPGLILRSRYIKKKNCDI